ncbi:MAG: YggT family protein [Pseudohongiellaceae bacterium]|jgi:YggT family protein
MGGALGQALVLIISSLGSLYLLAVLLRFLLQAARADFYNPVTQAIVKLTSPLVVPLRRIIPGYRGLDFATLVLALILNSLFTGLALLVSGYTSVAIGTIISWSFVGLIAFILNIYFWSLLVSVIASFIAPFSGHPVLLLIHQLLEPLYNRVRRILPPMGGLDFSPILMFLGIQVLEILIVTTLRQQLGMGDVVAKLVIGV